jgi:mono/diheme cytochrome c family protein
MSLRNLVLAGVLGFSLTACGGDAETDTDVADTETDETGTDTDTGPDLAAGEQIFGRSCSGCHGATGQGTNFGPNLGERVPGKSAPDVEGIVKNGSGNMSAITGLDAEEVTNVAAFVVSEWGP